MSEGDDEMDRLIGRLHHERDARLDDGRPEAVAKQHARGALTARERVALLCDPTSFVELGMMAAPATPGLDGAADGVVVGFGKVDGLPVAVASYDYTVLAGSQGQIGHRKLERLFTRVAQERCPLVILSEGAGARVHDLNPTPGQGTTTFVQLARLAAVVPIIGAALGHAYAGHANLLGLCDVIIGRIDATMGMSGPPLVEAALGTRPRPEELGPMKVHQESGVADVVVQTDQDAVQAIKTWLSFLAPSDKGFEPPPVRDLRGAVPANGRRAYDVRRVVELLTDDGSFRELRAKFAPNVLTGVGRIGDRQVAIIANQPRSKAGALDSNASDKAARFTQLADAWRLPILFLVDTPGYMVGPAAERTGLIRHSSRMLVELANAQSPVITVVLRKAFGLGYYAMGSAPFSPRALMAWPTAQFGGMSLKGAASIIEADSGSPEAAAGDIEQELTHSHSVWRNAEMFALDDVIDPADTATLVWRNLERGADESAWLRGKRHAVSPW